MGLFRARRCPNVVLSRLDRHGADPGGGKRGKARAGQTTSASASAGSGAGSEGSARHARASAPIAASVVAAS